MMEQYGLTEYEQKLYDEWVDDVEFDKVGKKTTYCLLIVKKGFEVVGTSACVDPANFVVELGQKYALKAALKKLDELQGFYRQLAGI